MFNAIRRSMIMAHSTMRAEQGSGVLTSFLQHLRTKLAKRRETWCDQNECTNDLDVLVYEGLREFATLSQEALERRSAIAQNLQSPDSSTKKSITDWLLFADDIDEANYMMTLRDQKLREAA
jgi:hypothetical protein